jgi:long-chain fatty acid transport protein
VRVRAATSIQVAATHCGKCDISTTTKQGLFMKKLTLHPLSTLAAAMLAAGYSSLAAASGYALLDQSGSSAGNSYAGAAAIAEDASTIYFNPAGLTYLKGSQIVLGLHVINVDAHYRKTSATSGAGTPATGGEGGQVGSAAGIPNFYYSRELKPNLTFGFGLEVPFGLKTRYDADWVGRYQSTYSALKSVNLNPSLGWKINDSVSLGAGINMQYLDAELVKSIDFGTICFGALGANAARVCGPLGFLPQAKDGEVRLKGNDWAYGFNLGAIFQLNKDTRLGVAYRSAVHHKLKGDVNYLIPAGLPAPIAASPSFNKSKVNTSVTTPEFLQLSLVHQLDPKLTLMGDITWNRWSRLEELRINFENGAPPSVLPEQWRNSFRYSIGANYQLNETWKLRTGIAYEQAGIQERLRSPVLPDNNRRWLAVGANYKMSNADSIDFAWAHGFISDSPINHSEPPIGGTIVGSYRASVDIVSLQYNHKF